MVRFRRRVRDGVAWSSLLFLGGCQWITGARERTLLAACAGDGDCPRGWRCLEATIGATCVENDAATCSGEDSGASDAGASRDAECPAGTVCSAGHCRATCEPTVLADCLIGQACVGSVCIGTDPDHDPVSAGGSGGQSGAGAAGSGRGGSSAGSSGRDGSGAGGSGAGGVSGRAGSGGSATAGSTSGEPCAGAPTQVSGDCKRAVCEDGRLVADSDETDLPEDGNSCTRDVCTGSTPSNPNVADSMPCPGGSCLDGSCVGSCNNGRRDGTETDIDCGGNVCDDCDDGRTCAAASDCESALCTACTGSMSCAACQSGCVSATCGTTPVTLRGACYVLVVRAGSVVEELSSQTVCDDGPRTFWPRFDDVVFVYATQPPNYAVAVEHPYYYQNPREWSPKCVNALETREDMLATLNSNWDHTIGVEQEYSFSAMSNTCSGPSAYKMLW